MGPYFKIKKINKKKKIPYLPTLIYFSPLPETYIIFFGLICRQGWQVFSKGGFFRGFFRKKPSRKKQVFSAFGKNWKKPQYYLQELALLSKISIIFYIAIDFISINFNIHFKYKVTNPTNRILT